MTSADGPLGPLSLRADLADYDAQAARLLEGWNAGEPRAIQLFRTRHPRFLDADVPWKPREMSDEAARAETFDLDDARLVVARAYDFADWARLASLVGSLADPDGPVARFEAAVEAVVAGDLPALAASLRHDPGLVHARSTRVTCFDPPEHRATLLHYVAANGVENFRQKTPPNAVEVARALLEAGAEPDALAHMYGGECTTMAMLVSSSPPADAGLQVPLVHVLVDFGASVNAVGTGAWTSPVMSALVFGFRDAAEALVGRGASVDTVAAAAGLGRADDARMLLADAGAVDRHRALALAAQNGQAEVVGVLLDAGEDPNRYNPEGVHSHGTPLHHAALAGHDDVVRLLVVRGARLDIRDTLWHSTPLGWAEYGGRTTTAAFLRGRGAKA
jgi:ankyrin repeat protein